MKTSILLVILTALSISLKGQFTIDELKSIRKSQIKAIYCDSLLLNRAQRIEQQDEAIKAQNEALFKFKEKEVIHQEKEVYYRELIRSKDKSINRLKRGNKLLKIGCISFGSVAAILGGLIYIQK